MLGCVPAFSIPLFAVKPKGVGSTTTLAPLSVRCGVTIAKLS